MDAPVGHCVSLMPLPFKEPSGTLLNLLGMLVDAGRRFASIGDMQIGDGNQEAPVGTTVACLSVQPCDGAIHKRLHYSQRMNLICWQVYLETICHRNIVRQPMVIRALSNRL